METVSGPVPSQISVSGTRYPVPHNVAFLFEMGFQVEIRWLDKMTVGGQTGTDDVLASPEVFIHSVIQGSVGRYQSCDELAVH
ncbi:hypothetical protein SUGI_0187150 [Cryptomeria japonica]|nr:hypothetical protein SUGI_0187150 [Cryptomeria japonica]